MLDDRVEIIRLQYNSNGFYRCGNAVESLKTEFPNNPFASELVTNWIKPLFSFRNWLAFCTLIKSTKIQFISVINKGKKRVVSGAVTSM